MKSKTRHLLKTISWRIISILATFCIVWAITGSIKYGVAIGSIEFFIKMILYYAHERFWHNVKKKFRETEIIEKDGKRYACKTIDDV